MTTDLKLKPHVQQFHFKPKRTKLHTQTNMIGKRTRPLQTKLRSVQKYHPGNE